VFSVKSNEVNCGEAKAGKLGTGWRRMNSHNKNRDSDIERKAASVLASTMNLVGG
jgi:hypothetical protein